MARLAVIVPNWNGEALLPPLLAALAGQTWRDFETVVVDNGSGDGSRALLARHPEVRLVGLERNRGFAAAINRGVAATRAPLVVLLNNDMEPEPGFLAALVGAAEAHPEAGSFACRVVFRDPPGRIDSCGDRILKSGRSLGIGRGEPDGEGFARERWVFGGTGGAVLYRREVLEAVGGFDEDFFLYVEDTDVALRAQALGWPCLYVPGARTRHRGSASMTGREDLRSRYCLRNHLLLLGKDYPLRLLWRHRGAVVRGVVGEIGFAFAASRARHGALRAGALVTAALGSAAWLAPRMLWRRARLRRRVPLERLEALLE